MSTVKVKLEAMEHLKQLLREADADLQGVQQRGVRMLASAEDVRAAVNTRLGIFAIWEPLFGEKYKP